MKINEAWILLQIEVSAPKTRVEWLFLVITAMLAFVLLGLKFISETFKSRRADAKATADAAPAVQAAVDEQWWRDEITRLEERQDNDMRENKRLIESANDRCRRSEELAKEALNVADETRIMMRKLIDRVVNKGL